MKYLIIVSLCIFSCSRSSTYSPPIKGITLEGSSTEISYDTYKKVDTLLPNYVAIIPFAYLKSPQSTNLIQHPEWQWWGEDSIGVIETIKMAHKSNHQVMIKPQLWIQPAYFTGDYQCNTDKAWEKFEEGYSEYILTYAKIAQHHNVQLFCIGNELKNFVAKRSQFWKELIRNVRYLYKGKITYAANWDNYDKIPFWSDIDYIGINAYFPLINNSDPTTNKIVDAWKKTANKMNNFSSENSKKIVFTEYGYRSIEFTTASPWESYTDKKLSLKAQKNAYGAFYKTFWNKTYIEGGFLWKWRVNGTVSNTDKSYSVVKKPAADIVRKYYKK